jgi:PTS system cellobiose-specific IIC component
MNGLINWLQKNFAPKLNKVARNPWISSLQESIYSVMPMILFGSLISIIGILRLAVPQIPDLSLLNSFTFGLIGIFVAFMLPYYLMGKMELNDMRIIGSATSVSLFLMYLFPTVKDGFITIDFARFGGGGMLCAFLSGYLTVIVFLLFGKLMGKKESDVLPEFIARWFQALAPITVLVVVSYIVTFVLGFDIYTVMVFLVTPITALVQTLPGYILLMLAYNVFYSMGLSTHVINSMMYPILIMAVNENIAAAAVGLIPQNIVTWESLVAFGSIGGGGWHLSLCLMYIFLAKSKRLKAVGKTCIAPVAFNINEPILFGTPIVFNPILMLPMWVASVIIPAVQWLAMNFGLVPLSTQLSVLLQMPPFVFAFMCFGFSGLILCIVCFLISAIVYYPFFKVYDKDLYAKENNLSTDNPVVE